MAEKSFFAKGSSQTIQEMIEITKNMNQLLSELKFVSIILYVNIYLF